MEHVSMVRGRGRTRVLGGMTEGEHVEGGGGRAVQHLEAVITADLDQLGLFTTRID